jgi:cell division initiation protein
MSLTPVEIRHVDLGRRPLGYDRTAVDELLADVAASFEHVWRERADLRDELEELESELARQKELEQALRNTLLSAERMADDMRAQARREADVIVAEASLGGARAICGAESERERIRTEIRPQEVETGVQLTIAPSCSRARPPSRATPRNAGPPIRPPEPPQEHLVILVPSGAGNGSRMNTDRHTLPQERELARPRSSTSTSKLAGGRDRGGDLRRQPSRRLGDGHPQSRDRPHARENSGHADRIDEALGRSKAGLRGMWLQN